MKIKLGVGYDSKYCEMSIERILNTSGDYYRIMIGGERNFDGYANYALLKGTLLEAINDRKDLIGNRAVIIVEGGDKGVDVLSKEFAQEYGYIWEEHPANWDNLEMEGAVIRTDKYGKPYNAVAGYMRNSDMIAVSDLVVLFHDGMSKGTEDDLGKAKSSNKDLIYIKY